MDSLKTNISDHYPIICVLDVDVRSVSHSAVSLPQSSKVKWDKIDKDAYNSSVAELAVMRTSIQSLGILDAEIQKLNEVLTAAAEDLAGVSKTQINLQTAKCSLHFLVSKTQTAKCSLRFWCLKRRSVLQNADCRSIYFNREK